MPTLKAANTTEVRKVTVFGGVSPNIVDSLKARKQARQS
jgi:hypothetical protein